MLTSSTEHAGQKSGGPNERRAFPESLKQKAIHEFEEFAGIFLYLAFFFCALATYSALLLNKFQISYFTYGSALINALVIAKVILIGEYTRLGKKHEAKPLLLSAVYKAFLFGLLVFGFHIVEELIKRLLGGDTMATASREIRLDDLIVSAVAWWYFALSFRFLPSGNYSGSWAKKTFEHCFSVRAQQRDQISPPGSEANCAVSRHISLGRLSLRAIFGEVLHVPVESWLLSWR